MFRDASGLIARNPPALHGGFYGAAGVIFIIERNQDSASFLQGLQFWR